MAAQGKGNACGEAAAVAAADEERTENEPTERDGKVREDARFASVCVLFDACILTLPYGMPRTLADQPASLTYSSIFDCITLVSFHGPCHSYAQDWPML